MATFTMQYWHGVKANPADRKTTPMTTILPPNTIDGAIDLGPFGTVDPTSHRFYRFLLNDQFLQ